MVGQKRSRPGPKSRTRSFPVGCNEGDRREITSALLSTGGTAFRNDVTERNQLLPYSHGRCHLQGCEALCDTLEIFLNHLSSVHKLDSAAISLIGMKLEAVERLHQETRAELDSLQSILCRLQVTTSRDAEIAGNHGIGAARHHPSPRGPQPTFTGLPEVRIILERIDNTSQPPPVVSLTSTATTSRATSPIQHRRRGRPRKVTEAFISSSNLLRESLMALRTANKSTGWKGIRDWISGNYPCCGQWQSKDWGKLRQVLNRDPTFAWRKDLLGFVTWAIAAEEVVRPVKAEPVNSFDEVVVEIFGLKDYGTLTSNVHPRLPSPSNDHSSSDDDDHCDPCGAGDDSFSDDRSTHSEPECGQSENNDCVAAPTPINSLPVNLNLVKFEPGTNENAFNTTDLLPADDIAEWDREFYRKSLDPPPLSDQELIRLCFEESAKEKMIFSGIAEWLCKNFGHFQKFTPARWKTFRYRTLPNSGLVTMKEGRHRLWMLEKETLANTSAIEVLTLESEGERSVGHSENASDSRPKLAMKLCLTRLRPEELPPRYRSEADASNSQREEEWLGSDREFYSAVKQAPPLSMREVVRLCFVELEKQRLTFVCLRAWLRKNFAYFGTMSSSEMKNFTKKLRRTVQFISWIRMGDRLIVRMNKMVEEWRSDDEETPSATATNDDRIELAGSDAVAIALPSTDAGNGVDHMQESASTVQLTESPPSRWSNYNSEGGNRLFYRTSDEHPPAPLAELLHLCFGATSLRKKLRFDNFKFWLAANFQHYRSYNDRRWRRVWTALYSHPCFVRDRKGWWKLDATATCPSTETAGPGTPPPSSEAVETAVAATETQRERHYYRKKPVHPPDCYRSLVRQFFEETDSPTRDYKCLRKWLCTNFAYYRKLTTKQWLAVYSVLYTCHCFEWFTQKKMFFVRMTSRSMCQLCKAAADEDATDAFSNDVRPATSPPPDESAGLTWDRERFFASPGRPPIPMRFLLRQCFLECEKRGLNYGELNSWFGENFKYFREHDELHLIQQTLQAHPYFECVQEGKKYTYTFDEDFFNYNPDSHVIVHRKLTQNVGREKKRIERFVRRRFKWYKAQSVKKTTEPKAVAAAEVQNNSDDIAAGENCEIGAPEITNDQSSATANGASTAMENVSAEQSLISTSATADSLLEKSADGCARAAGCDVPCAIDVSQLVAESSGDGNVEDGDSSNESDTAKVVAIDVSKKPSSKRQPAKPHSMPDLRDPRIRRYYVSHKEQPCFPVWALLVRCILESPEQRADCPSMYRWLATNFRHYRGFKNSGWGVVRYELNRQPFFVKKGEGKNSFYTVREDLLDDGKLAPSRITKMRSFMERLLKMDDRELDRTSDPAENGTDLDGDGRAVAETVPVADADDGAAPGWLLADVKAMEERLRIESGGKSYHELQPRKATSCEHESSANVAAENSSPSGEEVGRDRHHLPAAVLQDSRANVPAGSPSSCGEEVGRDRYPEIGVDKYRTLPRKPPFPLRAFIRKALLESPAGGMTLSEVKSWIEEHFLFYKKSPPTLLTVNYNLKVIDGFVRQSASKGNASRWTVDDDVYYSDLLPLQADLDMIKANFAKSSVYGDPRDLHPKLRCNTYRKSFVKPPFPLLAVVRQALVESPAHVLGLSEIFSWIKEQFPYYGRMPEKEISYSIVSRTLINNKCFVRHIKDGHSSIWWSVDDELYDGRKKPPDQVPPAADATNDSNNCSASEKSDPTAKASLINAEGGGRTEVDKMSRSLGENKPSDEQRVASCNLPIESNENRCNNLVSSGTEVTTRKRNLLLDRRQRTKRRRVSKTSGKRVKDETEVTVNDSDAPERRSLRSTVDPTKHKVSYREEASDNEEMFDKDGAGSIIGTDEHSDGSDWSVEGHDRDMPESSDDELNNLAEDEVDNVPVQRKRRRNAVLNSESESECTDSPSSCPSNNDDAMDSVTAQFYPRRRKTESRKETCDKILKELKKEMTKNGKMYKENSLMPPFTYRMIVIHIIQQAPDQQRTFLQLCDWFHEHLRYYRENSVNMKMCIKSLLVQDRCFLKASKVKGGPWQIDPAELSKIRPTNVLKRWNTNYNPRVRRRLKQLTAARRPPPVDDKLMEETRKLLLCIEKYRHSVTTEPPFRFLKLVRSCLISHPDEQLSVEAIVSWLREQFAFYRGLPEREVGYRVRENLSQYLCFVRSGEGTEECPTLWAFDPKVTIINGNYFKKHRRRKLTLAARLKSGKKAVAAKTAPVSVDLPENLGDAITESVPSADVVVAQPLTAATSSEVALPTNYEAEMQYPLESLQLPSMPSKPS